MTVHEAAGQLGVSPQRVRQMLAEGKLRGRKNGKPGREEWNVYQPSVVALKRKRGK